MGDEIHFLYECPKLKKLRVKYMYSPDIRREPNVFNFIKKIMQTNDPKTIGNLAKFILHGLKLYTDMLQTCHLVRIVRIQYGFWPFLR